MKPGNFRTPEEVVAKALDALREKDRSSAAVGSNGRHDSAVREMLTFVEENRTALQDITVKQLIR